MYLSPPGMCVTGECLEGGALLSVSAGAVDSEHEHNTRKLQKIQVGERDRSARSAAPGRNPPRHLLIDNDN